MFYAVKNNRICLSTDIPQFSQRLHRSLLFGSFDIFLWIILIAWHVLHSSFPIFIFTSHSFGAVSSIFIIHGLFTRWQPLDYLPVLLFFFVVLFCTPHSPLYASYHQLSSNVMWGYFSFAYSLLIICATERIYFFHFLSTVKGSVILSCWDKHVKV